MDILSYAAYIITFITITLYIFLKWKYGFWMLQPVFHIYDIQYMFYPIGIIEHELPEKNKYTNFKQIDTIDMSQLTTSQQSKMVQLIQTQYLQRGENTFTPSHSHIFPYFIGHSCKSFCSFYFQDRHLLDTKNGNIIPHRTIVGCMTSRPIQISIQGSESFTAYYVDYLCVHTSERKKGIAPQLIQTHHYNQRRLNRTVAVSLFKREDELTGIVPLCVYTTYGFPVHTWTKPCELSGEYKMLEINTHNFRFLHDFLLEQQSRFQIFICTDFSNIMELIKTNNLFITAILCDEVVCCCYIYRKSCIQVSKGLEVLSCIASVCNCEEAIFVQGFKCSYWKIAYDHHFGFAAIENISHNNVIIDHIMMKTSPTIQSPCAYYFYNFAYPTFNPEQTLIIQ